MWRALTRNRAAVALFAVAGLPLAAASLVSGLHPSVGVILLLLVVATAIGLLRLTTKDMAARIPAWRATAFGATALIAVAGLIQLVPYGRTHSNPEVTAEPAWASEATRELMVKACFDCHSNEVDYPWYANVAPISWAVARHVSAGRDKVNYSEWDRAQDEADETIETIREGSMPPWYYHLTHPRLTADEKDDLIAGLRATPGMSEGGRGDDDGDEADDDDD